MLSSSAALWKVFFEKKNSLAWMPAQGLHSFHQLWCYVAAARFVKHRLSFEKLATDRENWTTLGGNVAAISLSKWCWTESLKTFLSCGSFAMLLLMSIGEPRARELHIATPKMSHDDKMSHLSKWCLKQNRRKEVYSDFWDTLYIQIITRCGVSM